MKICILGNCGSGKTYVSQKLSKLLDINRYSFDDLLWENIRPREEKETLSLLTQILKEEQFIIEGVQNRDWIDQIFQIVDYIFVLQVPHFIGQYRLIKRYFKKLLKIEKGYKQDFKGLKESLTWRANYAEEIFPLIEKRLSKHKEKVYYAKNYKQIRKVLNK